MGIDGVEHVLEIEGAFDPRICRPLIIKQGWHVLTGG